MPLCLFVFTELQGGNLYKFPFTICTLVPNLIDVLKIDEIAVENLQKI